MHLLQMVLGYWFHAHREPMLYDLCGYSSRSLMQMAMMRPLALSLNRPLYKYMG